MTTLTEEMVIARSKQSNLAAIIKFNCWGSQLSDVSILRRMPNLTVVSLSVNSISTLVDFQYCKKLEDLYMRRNNIKDLNEICYLKDLKNLKCLWMDENPCAKLDEGYRLAVLRALPQLSKLDDVLVDSAEIEEAKNYGRVLIRPDQQQEYYSDPDEDEYEQQKYSRYKENAVKKSPSPEVQYVEPERETYSPDPYQRPREYVQSNATYEQDEGVELYSTPPVGRPQLSSIPRSRTADGELGCCNEWKRHRVCQTSTCSRRPPERRTNVLNAVLCLIKELDYPNLEVVEMAVRCRMDELEVASLENSILEGEVRAVCKQCLKEPENAQNKY